MAFLVSGYLVRFTERFRFFEACKLGVSDVIKYLHKNCEYLGKNGQKALKFCSSIPF